MLAARSTLGDPGIILRATSIYDSAVIFCCMCGISKLSLVGLTDCFDQSLSIVAFLLSVTSALRATIILVKDSLLFRPT
jgi:hypothetical protein